MSQSPLDGLYPVFAWLARFPFHDILNTSYEVTTLRLHCMPHCSGCNCKASYLLLCQYSTPNIARECTSHHLNIFSHTILPPYAMPELHQFIREHTSLYTWYWRPFDSPPRSTFLITAIANLTQVSPCMQITIALSIHEHDELQPFDIRRYSPFWGILYRRDRTRVLPHQTPLVIAPNDGRLDSSIPDKFGIDGL